MKTHVLMISRVFPKTHPRRGEPTNFAEKIRHGLSDNRGIFLETNRRLGMQKTTIITNGKLHTIRENYDLWAKRADQINAGAFELSVREWSGEPYRSKQREIIRLNKISVQRVSVVSDNRRFYSTEVDGKPVDLDLIAKNDGLAHNDFMGWFRKGLTDGALIHFTDFRYV